MKLINWLLALSLLPLAMSTAGAQIEYNYMLHYPVFTDSTSPTSWRSFCCVSNPWNTTANLAITILDANGVTLSDSVRTLNPGVSNFIRPSDLVGYSCQGSIIILSDQAVTGILSSASNNNMMSSMYNPYIFYIGPEEAQGEKPPSTGSLGLGTASFRPIAEK